MYDHLCEIYARFKAAGVAEPFREAVHLLDLLGDGSLRRIDATAADGMSECLAAIEQRGKGTVPLEYLVGRAVFMGNVFHCTPDTLIPTEDTDLLVRVVSEHARGATAPGRRPTIIEIGTGSGNIAITLALGLEGARILASDISAGAVEVARRNVAKHGVQDRVSLFCGDMFAPFADLDCRGAVDVVVSNPPYIPTSSLARLSSEIVDHEPLVALDGGPYGIDIYRKLIAGAREFLSPQGVLVFEIGERQEKLVERLLKKTGGYGDIACHERQGSVRVMSARKKT
ncbi:MAG TPA: peptide chain release factor N(5)-glutamine methyltransferase [bacterium]